MNPLRILAVVALGTLPLGGCAASPAQPADQPTSLSVPVNPGNPPVTLSGYVESSYTAHVK